MNPKYSIASIEAPAQKKTVSRSEFTGSVNLIVLYHLMKVILAVGGIHLKFLSSSTSITWSMGDSLVIPKRSVASSNPALVSVPSKSHTALCSITSLAELKQYPFLSHHSSPAQLNYFFSQSKSVLRLFICFS